MTTSDPPALEESLRAEGGTSEDAGSRRRSTLRPTDAGSFFTPGLTPAREALFGSVVNLLTHMLVTEPGAMQLIGLMLTRGAKPLLF